MGQGKKGRFELLGLYETPVNSGWNYPTSWWCKISDKSRDTTRFTRFPFQHVLDYVIGRNHLLGGGFHPENWGEAFQFWPIFFKGFFSPPTGFGFYDVHQSKVEFWFLLFCSGPCLGANLYVSYTPPEARPCKIHPILMALARKTWGFSS